MLKLPFWIGGALVALGIVGAGGVLPQMLENWLRHQGYIDHPENAAASVVAWLADPGKSWWLIPISAALLAAPFVYTAVQLIGRALRKRASLMEAVGADMIQIASRIRLKQGGFHNPWPGNFSAGRGKLDAILSRARKFWIKTPGDDVFVDDAGLDNLLQYLEFVGAHLQQGNFRMARKRARDFA